MSDPQIACCECGNAPVIHLNPPLCQACVWTAEQLGSIGSGEPTGLIAIREPAPNDRQRSLGVGRISENSKALLVALTREPTDDDMRSLHDFLREWRP